MTRPFQLGHYVALKWQLPQEVEMFTELKEELMELRVTEKGYRNALYANNHGGGCSSSTGSSSSLTCCKLSWN